MKSKYILILAVTALMTTCKKEKKTEFTPTDVTGTVVLKGNITRNVVSPNGNGGWTSNLRVAARGVNVTITVNKNSLYPNSTAQGADVYSGTTDNNGNYAITVKANANGVNAKITIDGFTGTVDTLYNGQTLAGLLASYQGMSTTEVLVMGQNKQLDYHLPYNYVNNNPNTIKSGTAMITGSVGVSFIKQVATGTLVTLSTTVFVVPDQKVYLSINNDPLTQSGRQYETTTDALGQYTFVVNTVTSGQSGFPQNINLWVNDMMATRDTILLNNTRKTGKDGVYKSQSLNLNAVFSNQIRNANYFLYNNFVQN